MGFAGKVWRLLVGIKDALALLFLLLFFPALFTVLNSRPSPGVVREGALLLELDGSVVEEVSPIDPLNALLSRRRPDAANTPRATWSARSTPPRPTSGSRRSCSTCRPSLGGGQVHMQEIGDALDRVRAAKKPVLDLRASPIATI